MDTTDFYTPDVLFKFRQVLRDHAAETHKSYPQYDGYFDEWLIGLATQTVRFKGYSEIPEGALVLYAPEMRGLPGFPLSSHAAYCPATASVCSMPAGTIKSL